MFGSAHRADGVRGQAAGRLGVDERLVRYWGDDATRSVRSGSRVDEVGHPVRVGLPGIGLTCTDGVFGCGWGRSMACPSLVGDPARRQALTDDEM